MGKAMQPCIRREMLDGISSALQRRDQMPYPLPNSLRQQRLRAGDDFQNRYFLKMALKEIE